MFHDKFVKYIIEINEELLSCDFGKIGISLEMKEKNFDDSDMFYKNNTILIAKYTTSHVEHRNIPSVASYRLILRQ